MCNLFFTLSLKCLSIPFLTLKLVFKYRVLRHLFCRRISDRTCILSVWNRGRTLWSFVIFILNDSSLPFQNNSAGKKDILSPFLLKIRMKFLFFGLFSPLLWFLCCHELIFWRIINLKYSTKSLQISSKPLKRSLYCRSSLFVFQAFVRSPVSRACLKRLSTAGSWPWLSYATHLLSSTAAKAAIYGICCDSWKRQLWRSSVKLWD